MHRVGMDLHCHIQLTFKQVYPILCRVQGETMISPITSWRKAEPFITGNAVTAVRYIYIFYKYEKI